jgi:hypothetical protein
VGFAAITLCVASQRVFIVVYFVIDSALKLLDTPSYIASLCQSARPKYCLNKVSKVFNSMFKRGSLFCLIRNKPQSMRGLKSQGR